MDSPLIIILLIGGGLVLFLVVAGIVVTSTSEKTLVEERLGRYLKDDSLAQAKRERSTPVSDWLNVRMQKTGWGGGISRELARADLKLKPAEYMSLMAISAFGVGFVVWFVSGRSMLFGILGAVCGLFLPRLYVRRQQGLRLRRFNEQLSDMLNLMVNGLRAGYSTMQAMEAVSKEMPAPICDEFRRVVQEMQLGIPMEEALDNLLRRIPSDDLDLVVTAMNVQREVGGNLSEILDTISYTIRERVRIKGEIRVLTAQVLYSGRVLALMPLMIFLTLWFMNRGYMMEFFNPDTRLFGIISLTIGGIMIISGYYVMNRIAKIEV